MREKMFTFEPSDFGLTLAELRALSDEELAAKSGMALDAHCVDCGTDTQPGCDLRKVFQDLRKNGSASWTVRSDWQLFTLLDAVWRRTGIEPYGGCLCIGCLENRIGRKLKPKDFTPHHPFLMLPGTPRLLKRQGRSREATHNA